MHIISAHDQVGTSCDYDLDPAELTYELLAMSDKTLAPESP